MNYRVNSFDCGFFSFIWLTGDAEWNREGGSESAKKKTIGNVSITTLFIQVIKCTYTGRVTMGNYYVSVVTSSLRLVVAEMK